MLHVIFKEWAHQTRVCSRYPPSLVIITTVNSYYLFWLSYRNPNCRRNYVSRPSLDVDSTRLKSALAYNFHTSVFKGLGPFHRRYDTGVKQKIVPSKSHVAKEVPPRYDTSIRPRRSMYEGHLSHLQDQA